MTDYSKITALYSRLSVGDEDRDGGESNSIQNQKIFLENYARGQHLTNIRHYIDDDESGRFFDRSAYSRMMDDVENGKIGVCIMKDLTRWGRDYLQVGNAMEIFRRNNVRFIAVNNGIDSEKPDTLEFAPFINIMSEWYAKDISKKVKTGMIKLVHHEMVINSKFLEVPRSYYQRNLNANRVKRIAAEFDERIANAPKVSYRDGHYYVFDGQHTIAARKLLNNNCDLNIVCKVYSGLTEQQEALLFAQQTGVSAPLTAGAKMRAKIRGGDPEAIAFLNATNRAGFGLSFAQSHAKWKIACIATAFAEYRKHGERIYTDALRVLAEAWEGDIDSLRAEVLQGVTQFVALYDHEYDPIRLIRQLQRTSPVAIYRSGQAMTGPNYQKYMLQILKAYNGSSRTKSLPIKQ